MSRHLVGRYATARYARLRSAAPEGGLSGWKQSNLQKEFYTPRPEFG